MKPITILHYTGGPLGLSKHWQPVRTVTWEQYERMVTDCPGEGTTWRAIFTALGDHDAA